MPFATAPDGVRQNLGDRSLVLVGMMGAGKTTIGRRLAARVGLPFVDVDSEIEKAAGQSVADIFAQYGEDHFRAGEQRVFLRLLEEGPRVLASGGGAFMSESIRDHIARHGISIWLQADFDTLFKRVSRRSHRPLLKTGDPKQVLRDLISTRDPVYAQANITAHSRDVPHDQVVSEILTAISDYFDTEPVETRRQEQIT
jgi:shikimate kinase